MAWAPGRLPAGPCRHQSEPTCQSSWLSLRLVVGASSAQYGKVVRGLDEMALLTTEDDGLAELRAVLHDIDAWREQWGDLCTRLSAAAPRARPAGREKQTEPKPGRATENQRQRRRELLEASAAVSEATSKVSLAGTALLKECEAETAAAAGRRGGDDERQRQALAERGRCSGRDRGSEDGRGKRTEGEPESEAERQSEGGRSGGRLWELVLKQWDDDRATILFGMRSGLGLGLGIGVGCAAGWILLLPLHLTILATTVCSLLVGLMLGPMASAAFGRRADGMVGRLCLLACLCSGLVCWSRIFRPATVESFRDAIVDITTPVQHSGTGQTVGLPRWGCIEAEAQPSTQQPQMTRQQRDDQAVCAAFYSCALLELRTAVGSTHAEASPNGAAQRHKRLVDALGFRTVDPVSTLLLLLQSSTSAGVLSSTSWLPPMFSVVELCGRRFVGVDESVWWPVPLIAAPAGELTRGRQQDELLVLLQPLLLLLLSLFLSLYLSCSCSLTHTHTHTLSLSLSLSLSLIRAFSHYPHANQVNGFAYRKGRVAHHSVLWQRRVLDWLASLLAALSQG